MSTYDHLRESLDGVLAVWLNYVDANYQNIKGEAGLKQSLAALNLPAEHQKIIVDRYKSLTRGKKPKTIQVTRHPSGEVKKVKLQFGKYNPLGLPIKAFVKLTHMMIGRMARKQGVEWPPKGTKPGGDDTSSLELDFKVKREDHMRTYDHLRESLSLSEKKNPAPVLKQLDAIKELEAELRKMAERGQIETKALMLAKGIKDWGAKLAGTVSKQVKSSDILGK